MEINIDVESVRDALSSGYVFDDVNDSFENYTTEWLTLDCLSDIFKNVNNMIDEYNMAKNNILAYLDALDKNKSDGIAHVKKINEQIGSIYNFWV